MQVICAIIVWHLVKWGCRLLRRSRRIKNVWISLNNVISFISAFININLRGPSNLIYAWRNWQTLWPSDCKFGWISIFISCKIITCAKGIGLVIVIWAMVLQKLVKYRFCLRFMSIFGERLLDQLFMLVCDTRQHICRLRSTLRIICIAWAVRNP